MLYASHIVQAAFDAVRNNPDYKIKAIKQFKESTGWGLVEAKTVIDLVTELVKLEKQPFEPDWSKVPEGYDWVAVDADKKVYAYKEQPKYHTYEDGGEGLSSIWGERCLGMGVLNLDPRTLIWKRPGQFFENWTEQDYHDHCGKFYVNQYDGRYMLAQVAEGQFRLISKTGNRYVDGSCFSRGIWREVDSW